MKALIVCHSGREIGLGHLSRCLVIAKALTTQLAFEVRFLICGDYVAHHELELFPFQFLQSDAVLDQHLISPDESDLVVLDLHPLRIPTILRQCIQAMRLRGSKVVAIDSLFDLSKVLDLIFVPSFELSVPKGGSGDAPVVYGWDCYLLNVKYAPQRWSPGHKVLVLTGGSDVTGLGDTLPQLLDQKLPLDAELHWVTGPYAKRPRLAAPARIKTYEHLAPSGLGQLISQVNYAVTVYGVSFFELLFMGVPTIVFPSCLGIQKQELESISKLGVAIVAQDKDEAVKKLIEIMRSFEKSSDISENAKKIFTGCGSARFIAEVRNILSQ